MCCSRIYSQCLLSVKQILCAIHPYETKPNFNGCDTVHIYDEGPDSAKQLNICLLSPHGLLVLVRVLKC